jgi:hypothetical protein
MRSNISRSLRSFCLMKGSIGVIDRTPVISGRGVRRAQLPKRRPVIEVVRYDHPVSFGRPHSFDRHVRCGAGKRTENTPGVKPASTLAAENAPQSISPGREIAVWQRSEQPARARTSNPRSVKLRPFRTERPIPSYFYPAHQPLIHAALVNQILYQPADRITGQSGNDAGLQPETANQSGRDIVFAAASQISKVRAVAPRRAPESRRNMTSPDASMSGRQFSLGLISSGMRDYRDCSGALYNLPGANLV